MSSAREEILARVRAALGRTPLSGGPTAAPEPMLLHRHWSMAEKLARFEAALTRLAGVVYIAPSPEDALAYVRGLIEGKSAIASNAPFLAALGVTALAGVRSGVTETAALREACATCDIGITSAWAMLAETGTLVLRASAEEPRMISLLPPMHVAIVPRERMLANLDELLALSPRPVESSSSLVLVTGPSRTGDIEQFLVRGVHGPGLLHVIIV